MGQEQKKYHISDNGDIFKINEDGSFTAIGNASQLEVHSSIESTSPIQIPSSETKAWLISNFNWLYIISLTMLIISGTVCIYSNCYEDSAMLGILSICAGVTAIVLPWVFKSLPKVFVAILSILLVTSLITIIVFSYEWQYTYQIAFAFVSLLAFGIAYAQNIIHNNKQLYGTNSKQVPHY